MRRLGVLVVALSIMAACGESGQYVATEAQRDEFRRAVEQTLAMGRLHIVRIEVRSSSSERRSVDYLAPDFTYAESRAAGARLPTAPLRVVQEGDATWAAVRPG